LDAILEAPVEMMEIRPRNGKYYLQVREEYRANETLSETGNETTSKNSDSTGRFVMHDNFAVRDPYDRVIRCLGFRFNDSIFSRWVAIVTRPIAVSVLGHKLRSELGSKNITC
jgi:hypothetical protein